LQEGGKKHVIPLVKQLIENLGKEVFKYALELKFQKKDKKEEENKEE
jgi:hypothetical protein